MKKKGKDVYVEIDRVRDKGNIGKVIRKEDEVGEKGVIIIGEKKDKY